MVDAVIDFPRGGELAPAEAITRADIKRHRKKEAKIEKVWTFLCILSLHFREPKRAKPSRNPKLSPRNP
jgi:hypothetical protein